MKQKVMSTLGAVLPDALGEPTREARTTGPLFSLTASGSVGNVITYSTWKGRPYVRNKVIPLNPNTTLQQNVRKAMKLIVEEWQGEGAPSQLAWDVYAKPFQMSGCNAYTKAGMNAYGEQLTTAGEPLSVAVAGDPPADVWTWAPVI